MISFFVDWWFATYGFALPEPMSVAGIFIDKMRGQLLPIAFYFPAGVIIATSLIVSIIPAFRAAKIIPVKALRYY